MHEHMMPNKDLVNKSPYDRITTLDKYVQDVTVQIEEIIISLVKIRNSIDVLKDKLAQQDKVV